MEQLAQRINNYRLHDVEAYEEGGMIHVQVQGTASYTQEVARKIEMAVPEDSKIWISNEELEIHGSLASIANT